MDGVQSFTWFQLFKALHIVGFVSWFAGLFYIVRLFIYHVEALDRPEPERGILSAQFAVMERRLWFAITVPAMFMTLGFGMGMLATGLLAAVPWLVVKLGFVTLLVGYHHICARIRRQLVAGTCRWTSARLRLWNEVATLLLVVIVMLAVWKHMFNALWGTLALVALGLALGIAVKLVRRRALRQDATDR